MSGLLALVSIVLVNIRVFLVMRRRSRVSDYLLVDGHGDRHIDQRCLGVFDYMDLSAVGKRVDLEDLVEDCGRTCWLNLADKMCVGSL